MPLTTKPEITCGMPGDVGRQMQRGKISPFFFQLQVTNDKPTTQIYTGGNTLQFLKLIYAPLLTPAHNTRLRGIIQLGERSLL